MKFNRGGNRGAVKRGGAQRGSGRRGSGSSHSGGRGARGGFKRDRPFENRNRRSGRGGNH